MRRQPLNLPAVLDAADRRAPASLGKGVGEPRAKDVGGVVAETDFALFAVNSAGTLSKIIREGDVIGGKTVSTVTVLSTVGGSAGVTHSFNSNGGVVSLVKFTDKTSAIISSIIP